MPFSLTFITIFDLYTAYRKAKREAFHDSNCAHGIKFARFETNLDSNLKLLLQKLTAPKANWFDNLSFIGRVTFIAKEVTPSADGVTHFTVSDPAKNWKRLHSQKKAKAEFRPVIDATVEFLIISALWIIKVGHEYDARLDSSCAVGNRLRRWRPSDETKAGMPGPINLRTHNLFQPYFVAYGGWRERGLKAMKRALSEGDEITAVTMDLKKFYHRVVPDFLLDPAYLSLLNLALTRDQENFTKQLIRAIATWNARATKVLKSPQTGLPVGLTASSVIANVLLIEFDRRISQLNPCYYGRYVDDVFLVLRNEDLLEPEENLLSWLAARLGKIARFEKATESEDSEPSPRLALNLTYAPASDLVFMGKKQKIFQLKGKHGLDLISPIEDQIRRQKSEHRDLADIPNSESEMAARALLVTSDATLDADALRKADAVTLRRAGFALLLGAVEQHSLLLEPTSWKKVRLNFYGLAERHLLTPRGFFDYPKYFPRILGIMVASNDVSNATRFIGKIAKLLALIESTCDANTWQLKEACRTLASRIVESIYQSRPLEAKRSKLLLLLRMVRKRIAPDLVPFRSRAQVRFEANRLFLADWGRRPYGSVWIESQLEESQPPRLPASSALRTHLKIDSFQLLRRTAGIKAQPHWPALAFPTRPLSIAEITAYAPKLIKDYTKLKNVISGVRGTWMPESSSLRFREPKQRTPGHFFVPHDTERPVRIAVTNFETTNSEWESAVDGQPILSLDRYRRLVRYVNRILAEKDRPAYVVLPECSLPRRWAKIVSVKLALRKVSLIAGLEYRREASGLRNEALISLTTDFGGYVTNIGILQPKLAPAWAEQKTIADLTGGLALLPPAKGSLGMPVYAHNNFFFGVLICSDFTTLENRFKFQGHIDCLVVPEWNPDLETFGSLMEAASHDLHAYIVQANNRQFGDSRIRAPYKLHYKRDLVRVKGGLHDYYVIDELNIDALRKFQNNPTPPVGDKEKYKPFPVGYRMSSRRQRLA